MIDHDTDLWGTHDIQYEYDNHNWLAAEVYPSGRKVEFEHDAAGRLKRVKDPFGFVSNVTYDDDGKGQLETLAHSTLGTATFTYNADDRLSNLELGNGAYTDYGYDAYGRLNQFDIKESDDDRLVKHNWAYDNLWRKGDITVTIPGVSYNLLDLTYDAKGELTRETFKISGGSNDWDVEYGYDDAWNRTAVDDGTIIKTLGYGGDNRETIYDDMGDQKISYSTDATRGNGNRYCLAFKASRISVNSRTSSEGAAGWGGLASSLRFIALSPFTNRKTAKAMMTKSIIVFRKTP